MRRVITIFVVLCLNIVFQSTILQNFSITGVIPNTAIIIVVSMALLRGSTEGAICGAAAGFLQDIFFGSAIGYYALLGMLLGCFAGKFNKGFYRENYALPVLVSIVSSFVYESCIFFTSVLFSGNTMYFYFIVNIILPETVYNAVATIIIYRILFSINSALEEKEKYKRKLFTIKR
ncbi:MAG: rod shape-determining protein MreD [Firmicutes bacterium]|nr:rod shape-determining protein MreD [Bacillota bacterium]